MYLYTIINEHYLDEVLSQGFERWQSESQHGGDHQPIWLMEHATVPMVTEHDNEVFKMIFKDSEAVYDASGTRVVAFKNAVSLKLRLRFLDQVRPCKSEDFDEIATSEPICSMRSEAHKTWSRSFMLSTAIITPNQIVGVSLWSMEQASWGKLRTGRKLMRHDALYQNQLKSTVHRAA